MATITSSWRAFEHTADVACFTRRNGVPARQDETSGHVVEVSPTHLRCSE